jgi:conjugal transfer ATP-binding protein TraC
MSLQTLNNIGEKILSIFGNSDTGTQAHQKKKQDLAFSKTPFSQLLPYESYDEESGIFIGKNSAGIVLEVNTLVGGDDSVFSEMESIFSDLMEEGSSVQCLLLADQRVAPFLNSWENARCESKEIYREISKERRNYLETERSVCSRDFRFFISYSVPYKSEFKASQKRSMKDIRAKFLKKFNTISYAKSLVPKDLLELLDGMVNFTFSSEKRQRKWNPYDSLSSQVSTGGALDVEDSHIEWKGEENCFKSFRVVDSPDHWSIYSMSQLIGDAFKNSYRFEGPFLIHFGVHVPAQEKEGSSFFKKMHLTENQGKSGMLRRMVPQLSDELEEFSHVRNGLHQGSRFVWTQLAVGIWSRKEELQEKEETIKSIFNINQFTLADNTCLHLPHFLSFLPMSWSDYVSDFKMLSLLKTTISQECANFIPIQGEWKGTPTPGVLLVGRRGQLLNWNPFDNPHGNYNVVVVGRSGSGKSVFMQDMLLSSLGIGSRVFVIETGRSFEKMCSFVDGQHIEFSSKNPLCLNPFTLIPLDNEEERESSFQMLKIIIASMADFESALSSYDNGLIERAILDVWEEKKNKGSISDIARVLKDYDDDQAGNLSVMLTPYVDGGVYSKYFDGENNVNFNNDMVLIELEELKDKKDLQCVVLHLFIMKITTMTFLGNRRQPFHICIDEAWDLLRGKQTGQFIETLARRLRKYNGSLVIGTQSAEDFNVSEGALAAFENSDWMCLLSQKKSSLARYAESGKIEDSESLRRSLESISTRHGEYSEIMITDSEGGYSIGRLHLDSFSELLYSTKADEFAAINDLQDQGHTLSEAIRIVAKKRGR